MPDPSVPATARARARAEITREIVDAGRRHLATDGAAGLSLRAVARELGMVSSAVYRYVASRDDLLTRLIVEAYDALGAAAEAGEAEVDRGDPAGRFAAVCAALRGWALDHPNEWALIYGSPVPGYVAPPETVAPAARVAWLLIGILRDAPRPPARTGRAGGAPSRAAVAALAPLRSSVSEALSEDQAQAGLMVWASLVGTVSFELFGQLQNVVDDDPGLRTAFFDECVRRWGAELGLS